MDPQTPTPAPALDPNTPAGRLAAAVKDRHPDAHPGVRAADVLAVADQVPPEKETEVTRALRAGAAGATDGLNPVRAARQTCHPGAGAVRQLLEAAGVVAQ